MHRSGSAANVQLEGKPLFGLDIGGSLLKVIYLVPDSDSGSIGGGLAKPSELSPAAFSKGVPRCVEEPSLTVQVPALGGTFHFSYCSTSEIRPAVQLLRRHRLCVGAESIHATGGGAHKYRKLLEAELGATLLPCNELHAVVLGICLMAKAVPDECYTFERVADPAAAAVGEERPQAIIIPSDQLGIVQPMRKIHRPFANRSDDFFPFLLCNVGTGVSILHVQSETDYTRVSGTALGGGTFLGLARLLTQARRFEEALEVAARGDARRVNMLVSDIYGSGDERSGLKLPGDLTASFFAKNIAADDPEADPRAQVTDDDICKSLVVMIAQNVAQIAHLNARIHGARRVFFTGNFLRRNDLALRTLVYTMHRWKQLDDYPTEAVFFRHEGYFGAIGAFLQTLDSQFVQYLSFDCSSTTSSCTPSRAASD